MLAVIRLLLLSATELIRAFKLQHTLQKSLIQSKLIFKISEKQTGRFIRNL